MKATYWQKGEVLDFTPTEDVKNGQVVPLVSRVGIAGSDIAAGEQGHLHVVGVFEMDKDDTVAIEAGAVVYYDAANDVITTTASATTGEEGNQQTVNNIPAGYAVADAAKADTTVLVKLLG